MTDARIKEWRDDGKWSETVESTSEHDDDVCARELVGGTARLFSKNRVSPFRHQNLQRTV